MPKRTHPSRKSTQEFWINISDRSKWHSLIKQDCAYKALKKAPGAEFIKDSSLYKRTIQGLRREVASNQQRYQRALDVASELGIREPTAHKLNLVLIDYEKKYTAAKSSWLPMTDTDALVSDYRKIAEARNTIMDHNSDLQAYKAYKLDKLQNLYSRRKHAALAEAKEHEPRGVRP